MFSQRKSFWKRPWPLLIILGILGIGYLFNQSDIKDPEPDNLIDEPLNQFIDNGPSLQSSVDSRQNNQNGTDTQDTEKIDNKSFFLVKKVEGIIEVYYYAGNNKEPVFVKNTDIEFSLLGEGDQALFSEGIIVETEEELNELLQDFGS